MMPTFVGVLLFLAALGCLLKAWHEHKAYTQDLDRVGRMYNVHRWENEPNKSYSFRIHNRIGINGGKLW